DLAVTLENGPALVAVWSGAVLAANPLTPASSLPLMAAFLALAPTDPSGARLAIRDVDGDGGANLVVVSSNPTNALSRVFTFPQVLAGGGDASFSYPLGTPY